MATREDQLRDALERAKEQILEQEMMLARLMSAPLVHATVVRAKNEFNLAAFERGDMLMVVDRRSRYKGKYGRIVSNGVQDGVVSVAFPNGDSDDFTIGLGDDLPQVKLLGKDDGTNVVITVNGTLHEVHGVPGRKFFPADVVKVDMQSLQIHDSADISGGGSLTVVNRVLDECHVEVEHDGHARVVIAALPNRKLQPGDRVMLDQSNTVVVRFLERDGADRFNLTEEVYVRWDDIAGLDDVKGQLIEAIELPYLRPDVFKHYNKKPPKGVALFGPPGCGKTLCGKAAAARLAAIHERQQMQSGFIYVKGPELLSKWVGVAEATIRELFARGREHFKRHGYPALLFIDEADAIMPQRGSGKSSDVENTIVPMFLSEMDGLESAHVMVMLATNQPQRLDPAITRDGRVDRKIRVGRPTRKNAGHYFNIHLRGVPLHGCDPDDVAALATAEIFSPSRQLYRLREADNGHPGKEHILTLGHCISGAMIAGIVDRATSYAMRRDLATGKKKLTGVTLEDIPPAVEATYQEQLVVNGTFDIDDYVEQQGVQRCNLQVEKLRPVA